MISATFGFSGKPESLSKGNSGSLTIPAGKFAWVTLSCKNGGTCSLDGTTCLESDGSTWNALGYGNGMYRAPNNGTPSIPNGQPASGLLTGNTASNTISGAQNAVDVYAQSTAAAYDAVSISLWVPAGTVISGTGDYCYTASIFSG